ncbi:MAG: hypothetical protein KDD11_07710 [Acidobacteria bacterium]|nr:hypothetical protein [Acidobacteriota bacterium]
MHSSHKHLVAGLVTLLAVVCEGVYRLGLAGASEAPRMLAVGLVMVALLIFAGDRLARRRDSRN